MQNTETTANIVEAEKSPLVLKGVWIVLYMIGFMTLVSAVIETMCIYLYGLFIPLELLSLILPLFIGIPAVLLSIIYAVIYRLHQFPTSSMLLLTYILVIGCILCLLAVSGRWLCILAGHPLGIVVGIPLFIGVPATVLSIKSAFVSRPSRQHLSAVVLLAHLLLYAVNVVCGLLACG
jgi:hypothetical protein